MNLKGKPATESATPMTTTATASTEAVAKDQKTAAAGSGPDGKTTSKESADAASKTDTKDDKKLDAAGNKAK